MKLLILINGSAEQIFSANSLDETEFTVRKIDEKELYSPKRILSIIQENSYNSVYFGCIELELQRFQRFMLIYSFLGGIRSGGIIDQQGNKNIFSLTKLFFVELPMLAMEFVISGFAVIFYHIKIPIDKWQLKKRNR